MKKILALAMCLALMMTSFVFVSAEADATITVGTVEGPFAEGEEVAIPVDITEWANAYAVIELEFEYDAKFLELDAIEKSDSDFGGAMAASNENKFSLICNPSSQKQANKVLGGEVCIVYFYAAADIEYSIPVKVTAVVKGYAQGETDNWTENTELNVEIVNGGVHVEGADGPPVIYGYANVTNATAQQGDQVTLTAALGENTSLATYGATLNYDKTALKLLSMEEGEFCSIVNATSGMAGGYENYNVTSGTLFTATFKVLAESGEYAVEIVFDAESTKRDDLTPVNMTATSGVVSVTPSSDAPEDYDATITIDTVNGPIYAGDEVAVPITITEWANAYGCIEFELNYDDAVLKLDSIEASETDFAGAMTAVNGNKFALIASPSSESQATNFSGGEICVAYFTALADISEDTTINFAFVEIHGYAEGKNDSWMSTKKLNVDEVYGGITAEPESNPYIGYAGFSNAMGEMGDQVTVTVWLVGDTAIAAYGATLVYDETALKLVSMEKGTFCETVNVETKHANGYSTENVTFGTLFNATFEILVAGGNYTVDLVFDANSTANEKDELVTMEVTPGTIYVQCAHDGEVEIRNAVEANCGVNGYTGDHFCFDCQTVFFQGTIIPASGDHSWNDGEFTTVPSCVSYGVLTYTCTVCQGVMTEELGLDVNNHIGQTEVRNAFDADCSNQGYTGDTYCLDCGVMIKEGEVVPATGAHVGGTATCCEMAICNICGQFYGEIDADNHTGETELRNYIEENCGYDGYTGDTYCLDCGAMVEEGEDVPATGAHVGGEATCCTKAFCEICHLEYGEFNTNNHIGGSEVRDASETYTGDTYCLGCGAMIEKGEKIWTGVPGDANGDGFVNAMDAMLISQYYVGLDVEIDIAVSDVNGDGNVNAMDAMLISQFYVGLIDRFPAQG
ncbi:MAG: hypothetical protein IJ944_05920 [Clostridia bacterium]|nr:hypothetical protein [Clostridia bacterium]